MTGAAWQPKVQERCFVFHGPVLYEATIKYIHRAHADHILAKKDEQLPLAVTVAEKKLKEVPAKLVGIDTYYVHYKGWPKSWDEWANPIRILPYNSESIRKSKELKKAALDSAAAGIGQRDVRKVEIAVQVVDGGVNGTKAKQEVLASADHGAAGEALDSIGEKEPSGSSASTGEENEGIKSKGSVGKGAHHATPVYGSHYKSDEESFIKVQKFLIRAPFSVDIPKFLRQKIVQDCDNIRGKHLLLALPARVTVSQVLEMYSMHYRTKLETMGNGSHRGRGSNSGSTTSVPDLKGGSLEGGNGGSSIGSSSGSGPPNGTGHRHHGKSEYSLYAEFLAEFLDSVSIFFNRSVEKLILYDFERPQLESHLNETTLNKLTTDTTAQLDKTVSVTKYLSLYGVHHLLRLLSILPDLICQHQIDNQARDIAKFFIQSIFAFIELKRDFFFQVGDDDEDRDYYAASEEYVLKFEASR